MLSIAILKQRLQLAKTQREEKQKKVDSLRHNAAMRPLVKEVKRRTKYRKHISGKKVLPSSTWNDVFGRELPHSIIRLIFSFDSTYPDLFKRCINQYAKGCFNAQRYRQGKYGATRFVKHQRGYTGYYNRFSLSKSKEERTALWVDERFVHRIGKGPLHIESTELVAVDPSSYRYEEWNTPYSVEYYASHRNWTSVNRNFRFITPGVAGRQRSNPNLPLYHDKPVFIHDTLNTCLPNHTYGRWETINSRRRRQKWVKPFLKNIKKWDSYYPDWDYAKDDCPGLK
jgi:hypothetical protein